MAGSGFDRRTRLTLPPVRGAKDTPVTVGQLTEQLNALKSYIDRLPFGRVGWKVWADHDQTYADIAVGTTQVPFAFIEQDSSHFTNRRDDEDMLFVQIPPSEGGQYALSWNVEFYEIVENTVTYNATGSVQEFTVPAGCHFITVTCEGAQGGIGAGGTGSGGKGHKVEGTWPVVPGTVYDVYVGKQATTSIGGYPNGGAGGNGAGGGTPGGGGGASYMTPDGAAITSALMVGAGGGGRGEYSGFGQSNQSGGYGGYPNGQDGQLPGQGHYGYPGAGATQSAGGAGGSGVGTVLTFTDGESGDVDGTGQGGDAWQPGTGAAAVASGGGGGGWHGGGAGGGQNKSAGGGSGYAKSTGRGIVHTNNIGTGDGQIVVTYLTTLPIDSDQIRAKVYVQRRFTDSEVLPYVEQDLVSEDAGYSPVNGTALVDLAEGDRVLLKIESTSAVAGYYLPHTWLAGNRIGY